MMHKWSWMNSGDMGGGWMWLWWILGAVLITVGILALLRSRRRRRAQASGPSHKDILKNRYAKGDIDRETYQRMMADLKA